MSSSITLTLRELQDATSWATDHVRDVHKGTLPHADIRIYRLDGSIAGRAIVLCEACDRVRVSTSNHHDITDYDAA